ncbi:hypothetical protein ElyMa_004933900 [Elysia marginata]|uniref:Uncharacterized protein n=1 Tax=Elysia marginata TaxID=1093978 RepID=A0AAV4J0V7_9GAST|nr:hypothetical protein ElyMa_004933900 [Elysia marginata]
MKILSSLVFSTLMFVSIQAFKQNWFLLDRICEFTDVKFEPFKVQYAYQGCIQCVCLKGDAYQVLVCRMVCPRWFKYAGPPLSLDEDGILQ